MQRHRTGGAAGCRALRCRALGIRGAFDHHGKMAVTGGGNGGRGRRSKLSGHFRTKGNSASFFCLFEPVESSLVAKVSIGVRRRCGDIDRVVTAGRSNYAYAQRRLAAQGARRCEH